MSNMKAIGVQLTKHEQRSILGGDTIPCGGHGIDRCACTHLPESFYCCANQICDCIAVNCGGNTGYACTPVG